MERRLETRGTKSRAYFLLTGLGCALVHFYWPMPVTQREGGDVCGTSLLQVQSFSLDWSFSLPRRGEPQGKEEHWECGAKQGQSEPSSPSSLPLSLSFFFLRRCGKGDQSTFSHLKGRLHRVLEEHLFERKGVCRRVNSFPYRCPWLPSVWPNPGVPSFSWKTV